MAIINVTPLTDITDLIASDNVTEGDVLQLEEGIYFQTVNVTKGFIRIVAKGPGVIFDGNNSFFTAFTLSGVTGVAIEGITIRHYTADGVLIFSGSGNRIINNKMIMLGDGIQIRGSNSNLVWRNEICDCTNGVIFTLGSTNNWIIENTVRDCSGNAFFPLSSADSNNSYIFNIAIGNRNSGLNILGSNNLLLYNLLVDNGQGIMISDGSNSVAIGNFIKDTGSTGQNIAGGYVNFFAGDNIVRCSGRTGIQSTSQFGMFLNNEISYNRDNGISLGSASSGNLVMDNKLRCNIPENIVDSDTNNNFIDNMDKPCEPCESPTEVCRNCWDEMDFKEITRNRFRK